MPYSSKRCGVLRMTPSKQVLLIHTHPETPDSKELASALRRNGAELAEHWLTKDAASYDSLLDALRENVLPIVVKL